MRRTVKIEDLGVGMLVYPRTSEANFPSEGALIAKVSRPNGGHVYLTTLKGSNIGLRVPSELLIEDGVGDLDWQRRSK